MNRRFVLPLTLGLAHGAADGAAGLLLGGFAPRMPLAQVALLVLLYNILAFGAQPLAGIVADRLGRPRGAVLAGLALLAAALLAGPWPQGAALLAGLGSAAFHVGGGALALAATRGRASGPGVFAAPGVVGLAVGGALAAAGIPATGLALALLAALACAIAFLPQTPPAPVEETHAAPIFEPHDLVMLALLAGIALRSAVWSSLQLVFAGRYDLLIAMAVAAALGKMAGGALADWLGWRRWATLALLAAAPLLALGKEYTLALLAGAALLQSATPVGIAVAARLLPGRPATATGLVLGLAVALGGLPQIIGFGAAPSSPTIAAGTLLAAALAVWWALGRRASSCRPEASAPQARQL